MEVHGTGPSQISHLPPTTKVSDALSVMSQRIADWVGSYPDLLGFRTFDIYRDNLGELSVVVHQGTEKGESKQFLPLVGHLTQEMSKADLTSLRKCLSESHFMLERGTGGVYTAVKVEVSGDGGGRAKIPMQPGFELGAIVDPAILNKMTEYAAQQEKSQGLEDQVQDIEQRISVLQAKIKARGKDDTDSLTITWKAQIANLEKTLSSVTTEMTTMTLASLPTFSNFVAKHVSPIDKAKSTIEVLPTGFDSLTFQSQYVSRDSISNYIQDSTKQNSSAYGGSLSAGWGPWSAKVSHSMAKSTTDRLSQLQSDDTVEGILVINAFLTTRNTRCYTDIMYDKAILQSILDAMNKKDDELHQLYGITTLPDQKETKAIYVLTEAVLGGSFTGLLTYRSKTEAARKRSQHATEKQTETGVSGGGGFGPFKAKVGVSASNQNAEQSEDDKLDSTATMDVSLEVIAQGALPAVITETVKLEMLKMANMDTADFQSSSGKQEDVSDKRADMQKRQTDAVNNKRGTETVEKVHSVATPTTAVNAYNHFVTKITNGGIPVGFNYRIYTKKDIEALIGGGEKAEVTARKGKGRKDEA